MEALPSSGTPVFSIIAEDSVHDYTNLHHHKESDVQDHLPRSLNVFSLHGKFTSVIPEETEGIDKHCKKVVLISHSFSLHRLLSNVSHCFI